jgi:hypothetical protein
MKKYFTAAAFSVIALLSFTASFAAGNNNQKQIAIPAGATVTKLKTGTIVIDGATTTAYDKKGNLVYTIKRFSAENVPMDIFKTVRGTYGNYFIAGLEKIEQPGSDSEVVVHLRDNNENKTVKLSIADVKPTEDFVNQ